MAIMNDFIQLFVSERLDGDIENLANYDLKQLENDVKFGCDNRAFDCDDTNIVRAIFALVYEDVWPELSYQSFITQRYRCDTINTFATLFGKFDGFEIKGFDRIARDSEIRPKVIQFYSKYHTIGNMMVLPNIYVGRSSLNLYRGCHPIWHDYMDRFLVELRNNLIGEPTDEKLSTIIRANEFAFSKYHGTIGFNKLIQGLYLEDYFLYLHRETLSKEMLKMSRKKIMAACILLIFLASMCVVVADSSSGTFKDLASKVSGDNKTGVIVLDQNYVNSDGYDANGINITGKNLVIKAEKGKTVTIDANNAGRIFNANNTKNVTFENINFVWC